jgi:hypothetical protein
MLCRRHAFSSDMFFHATCLSSDVLSGLSQTCFSGDMRHCQCAVLPWLARASDTKLGAVQAVAMVFLFGECGIFYYYCGSRSMLISCFQERVALTFCAAREPGENSIFSSGLIPHTK